MNNDNLIRYGLTPEWEREASLYEDLFPARVTEQHRNLYKIACNTGERTATVSGKLSYELNDPVQFPSVGDWVAVKIEEDGGNAVIRHILRRKSAFVRKAAGTSAATQVVAANIDTVFLCMSLNADYNLRRLERYLAVAWDSGAVPVIVLTKADLCGDRNKTLCEISAVSAGADILFCSSISEDGITSLLPYLKKGLTAAFLGSSGVGKSTLINKLLGREVLATGEVRGDDKGRHVTTHRQLLLLPTGGIVIDTPGMRELHLDSGDLSRSFEDIEELSASCRYRDCTHTSEPGCAVQKAAEDGNLSSERLNNYHKLKSELGYEGLSSRQMEQEKIKKMFGGKGELKQARNFVKNKHKLN